MTDHSLLTQVRDLTEDMAALEAENERLTEVINAEQPHNEELLLHVKELQHVRFFFTLLSCTVVHRAAPDCIYRLLIWCQRHSLVFSCTVVCYVTLQGISTHHMNPLLCCLSGISQCSSPAKYHRPWNKKVPKAVPISQRCSFCSTADKACHPCNMQMPFSTVAVDIARNVNNLPSACNAAKFRVHPLHFSAPYEDQWMHECLCAVWH